MGIKRTLLLASSALCVAQPVWAQDQDAGEAANTGGEVVVTGYRTSLAQARNSKRDATIIKDSIAASDIAAFPDLNLAEALQRLPGVAINREAGEGRRISLRGLGPDFTRVQLNGMEVLGNVDSPQDSRGQTTRDRAFDFNLFAAELFNHVDVEKSYQAQQTEGGLAGTVGLFTARPFDYKGTKIALSAQGGTNTLTRDFQPRLTGLISKNWGNFGILVSGAYSRRNTREEGFDTYRWRRNKANGSNISGLTAAEQAKINSGDLLFARGNRLSVWDSKQERIGLTTSVQWAPTDKVHVTLDGLYGQFKGDRFETHLASRGGGSSTWLGGGETFAGTVYPNSRVNAIQWNDRNEVTYLDVSGGKASTETRIQNTKNVFKQAVLSGDAELVDGLTFTWLGGVERSRYDMPVNDKFTLEGFGDVISDYRGGTYSLVNTYKFNTSDPNFWHAKRLYVNNTFQDSAFDNVKGRFDYKVSADDTISVGGEWRRFANSGYYAEADNVMTSGFVSGKVNANPSAYAQTYNGYSGQSWTIVDFSKMLQTLGIDRSQYLTNKVGVYAVEERTGAAFVQYDWNHMLAGVPFRGNIGARYYRTTVTSQGNANVGPVTVRGEYEGVLPAANFIFELNPGLMVRFAASKNINRPALGALAVNGSVTNDNGNVTVSIGNPNLRPYKSTDFDISTEYYFGSVGYVAGALFYKTLDGYISTQTINNVPYSQTGLPDNVYPGVTGSTVVDSYSRPVNLAKTNLFGIELSGQTDFKFLLAPFDRLGTAVNFTYVDSRLDYAKIYQGSIPTTLEGLSKYNANATLYYQDKAFDARVSANYRSGYIFSASPVLTALGPDQDVTGFEGTVYVDMSAHYSVTKNVQLTLNGINLTNQREKQYSNSTKRLYVVTRSGTTLLGGGAGHLLIHPARTPLIPGAGRVSGLAAPYPAGCGADLFHGGLSPDAVQPALPERHRMSDPIAWAVEGRTRLLAYVRRRIREPEQAEDIVQEAIMRVIEQEGRQVIEQPLAYAFRVADSVIHNRGRRPAELVGPVDPEIACALPLADEVLDYRQRFDRFQTALSRLPAQRRAVFVERHIEGKSRQQIAEEMGLSIEAVKKHLVRAMIDLDGCIDGLPPRGGPRHD